MAKPHPKSIAWLSCDTRAPILVDSTVCLGRSKNCNVVLEDPSVSRRHAAVHLTNDNDYWISDLGGRHGVFVNDLRIDRSARLQHGDLIRILRYTFRFLRADATSFSTRKDGSIDFALSDGSVEERWLLVADIQEGAHWGTTPDAVPYDRRLDQWYRLCRGIIEDHEGRINKFMGNGFLANWIEQADAVNHVHQALTELNELQKTGDVPFRLVLHRAEVTVSSVGSVGGESLLGAQVNHVFRMEKVASANGFSNLISGPAARGLATLMALERAADVDDLTFGPDHSFFMVPGNHERVIPLSDSDGDGTAQTLTSPSEGID